jgi:hypothetical protein
VPADAGRPLQLFSIAFGPARLHSALGSGKALVNIANNKRGETPPQRRKRLSLTVALTALLGVAFAFASQVPFPSPDGVYYDPYVGCVGDAYWVFGKGQLSLRTPESSETISSYSKDQGRWISRTVRGDRWEFSFKATILGIRIHDTSGQEPDKFMFRRSFSWVPKTRTWMQLHRPS